MQKNNLSAPMATNEQLQVFFDLIKDIDYKNHGGCLFFCYVFFLWLKKNNYSTTSFSIIQYQMWGSYIEQNEAFIRGENSAATSSSHFTWKYNGIEYDADGFPKPMMTQGQSSELKGLQTRYGSLVKCFCESALINGDWNTMFNRNRAIEKINKTMKLRLPKKLRYRD